MACSQQIQFLVPADERCHLRAQCLEATQDLALTEYAPRPLWYRKAGESLRPEIGEFETRAEK